MNVSIDRPPSELFNVFEVCQIAPGTFLDSLAGVDYVAIAPHSNSEVHRHNHSDSILFVISGSAIASIGGVHYDLSSGVRILIPKGVTHGFKTHADKLTFLSVQVPSILDRANNVFDREVVGEM
jgi:quercetin dioxygenase-like cupin family protein